MLGCTYEVSFLHEIAAVELAKTEHWMSRIGEFLTALHLLHLFSEIIIALMVSSLITDVLRNWVRLSLGSNSAESATCCTHRSNVRSTGISHPSHDRHCAKRFSKDILPRVTMPKCVKSLNRCHSVDDNNGLFYCSSRYTLDEVFPLVRSFSFTLKPRKMNYEECYIHNLHTYNEWQILAQFSNFCELSVLIINAEIAFVLLCR